MDWNPILESPVGLALLFDELWFFHPGLCPDSLVDTDFVRFLSEDGARRQVVRAAAERIRTASDEEALNALSNSMRTWEQSRNLFGGVLEQAAVAHGQRNIDNHSRWMEIDGVQFYGNSWSPQAFATDLLVSQELLRDGRGPELTTNTFTTIYGQAQSSRLRAALAESVVVKRVPALTPLTPSIVHELEFMRENALLAEFREKIARSTQISDDLTALSRQIDEELLHNQRLTSLHHIQSTGTWATVFRTLFFSATAQILPGSDVIGAIPAAMSARKTAKIRWTGFLTQLEIGTY